jgi:DNA polymerase III epsilon subunit-like protein
VFAFSAIDFETTGAVPGLPNEPWQVGVVSVPADAAIRHSAFSIQHSAFESLLRVSPDRPFNRWAAAPALADLWPALAPRLAGPVVAHNVGTERSLLQASAPLHVPGPWIDTLALARRAWPAAPSHALEDLVPALGLRPRLEALLPGREPHDALYDALACALLLLHVLAQPGWRGLSPAELAGIR